MKLLHKSIWKTCILVKFVGKIKNSLLIIVLSGQLLRLYYHQLETVANNFTYIPMCKSLAQKLKRELSNHSFSGPLKTPVLYKIGLKLGSKTCVIIVQCRQNGSCDC